MVDTRLVTGSAAGVNIITTVTTQYQPLGNGIITAIQGTEVNVQTIYRAAGVFSNLYVRIISSATGTKTVNTRKNAGAGSQTVSIGASANGVFEDTTHTDTVTAGDKWNYSITSSASASTNATVIAVTFAATTNTVTKCLCNVLGTSVSGAVTRYNQVIGKLQRTTSTEANAKTRMRKAGTFTNMAIYLTANGWSSGTNTAGSRLNGAAGANTITITNSTTGWFEDTTHTDTVAIGDDFNSVYTSASAGAATIQYIGFEFTSTTGDSLECQSDSSLATVNANVTTNYPISGDLTTTTTEANAKCLSKDTYTCSQLTINAITNGVTAASTLIHRMSGANGNQVATVTASTPGLYSDTTHTDVMMATDDMNYQLATGATGTSMTISFMDMVNTIVTSTLFSRPISETLALAESIRRKPIPKIAESLTLAESSIKRKLTRKQVEALTLSEAIVQHRRVPRAVSETVTLTENIKRRLQLPRAETLGLAETSPVKRKLLLPRTESIGLAESVLRKVKPKTILETITLLEVTRRRAIRRAAETLQLVEAINRFAKFFRIITDTLTLAEVIAAHRIFKRVLAETLGLAESVLRKVKLSKSDTLSLTESRFIRPIRKLTETVTLAESSPIKRKIARRPAETLALSESFVKLCHFFRPISDTLTLAESISAHRIFKKVVAETVQLVETAIKRKPIRKAAESLTLTETSIKRKMKRAVSEPLTLSESISAHRVFTKIVAETLALAESLKRKYRRSVVESVSLAEAIARRKKFTIALAETLHLVESISAHRQFKRLVSETIALADSISRFAKHVRPVPETLALTEAATRKIKIIKSESVALNESIKRKAIRLAAETLHTVEAINRRAKFTKSVLESLSLVESISLLRKFKRTIAESLVLSESLQRKIARNIPAESVSLVESIARRGKYFKAILETVHLAEFAFTGRRIIKSISIVETVRLLENVVTVLTRPPPPPSAFPKGQGWGGVGEAKNRPRPVPDYTRKVRSYVRDYTMAYRKRWKGLY